MVQSSTIIVLIRKAPLLLLLSLFLTSTLTITATSAAISPTTFSRNTGARTISSKSLKKNTPYLTQKSLEDKTFLSQNQNKLIPIQRGGSTNTMEPKKGLPDSVKLLIGAGGIYAAFLYYGSLQEDVFRFVAPDDTKFTQAWFLQVLEATANVIIGFIGMQLSGATANIPKKMFAISGAAQVSAKACTSLALANGLSFPVATLAKSGKMAPVMAGSLLLGGAKYETREYLQVAAIIGGTAIVSMGKKKAKGGASSSLGVAFIVLSLILDGVTAGFQKRLKVATKAAGVNPKPYDFMFWTNVFMALTAIIIAAGIGEFTTGMAYVTANPDILPMIIKFAICSAVGQSFIFYTIANFDPLVLSTVTTTRKIFSVLLSIFLKGHSLSAMGWSGIALACSGILSEMKSKAQKHSKKDDPNKGK